MGCVNMMSDGLDAERPDARADSVPPIFDGHNDVLLHLYQSGGASARRRFVTGMDGHVDAHKASRGGFGGGFFAVYVPSPSGEGPGDEAMMHPPYDLPLPNEIPAAAALPVVLSQKATLLRLEADGVLRIARVSGDIERALDEGALVAVLHMEGAEAIDRDFDALHVLYAAGLRSLGPVWSRPSIFGHGVPFRFPSDGDTGPGLTDDGIRLVRQCNDLGIMVDVSHLNEAGFWDVARHSTKPLVATHSNAHALSHSARNLTDRQLDAIAETGGMVGVNFATSFLREDGRMVADTPIEDVLRHLDYLLTKLGEDGVGFGSDFDGATVPDEIGDVSGLPKLRRAMRWHGYDEPLMKKICNRNWVRVLKATWRE
jgi:membrane dipeptidase